MGIIKTASLVAAALALAATPVLGHGDHLIKLGPIERRDLNHCEKNFKEEEFVRRTVEIHGREFARRRRSQGLGPRGHGHVRPPCAPCTLHTHTQVVAAVSSGTC